MNLFQEIEFTNWKQVGEDFLKENFINDPVTTAEEKKLIRIDPSMVYFSETPFDKYYYKQKYPKFDDELCEILERCSIIKMQNAGNPPTIPVKEGENFSKEANPSKKPGVEFKKENFIVSFD